MKNNRPPQPKWIYLGTRMLLLDTMLHYLCYEVGILIAHHRLTYVRGLVLSHGRPDMRLE